MTPTDDQPDEATEAAETPDETPEERLDALGADIDRVRQQAGDGIEGEDRQFIESGEEEPVDDTITPPG